MPTFFYTCCNLISASFDSETKGMVFSKSEDIAGAFIGFHIWSRIACLVAKNRPVINSRIFSCEYSDDSAIPTIKVKAAGPNDNRVDTIDFQRQPV